MVTLEIGELIWEKIPFKLFMIRVGNHLVALTLAGIILAVWRWIVLIPAEEEGLRQAYGDQYVTYQRKTRKLIPLAY